MNMLKWADDSSVRMQLMKKTLEVTVWDYDRFSSNDFLGEVSLDFWVYLLVCFVLFCFVVLLLSVTS
jgi:hypothetical protein